VAKCATVSLNIKGALVALCLHLAFSGTIQAQNSGTPPTSAVPNAVVKVDLLEVYPEMSRSGSAVQSLKKGDAVIIELEFQTTERWCSIKNGG